MPHLLRIRSVSVRVRLHVDGIGAVVALCTVGLTVDQIASSHRCVIAMLPTGAGLMVVAWQASRRPGKSAKRAEGEAATPGRDLGLRTAVT